MEQSELEQLFTQQFDRMPRWIVAAPGRVNIIGEHTDYNDGFVLPAAIDRFIRVLAAPRDDLQIRAYSADFAQSSEFLVGRLKKNQVAPWSNYLRGVLDQYSRRGFQFSGADLLVSGNVPIGAGLSSSAAFEVAVAETFRCLYELDIGKVEMALLCQAAEREFVGVQCGIMDQFVSTLAEEGRALFLDCRDLSYSTVPLGSKVSLVVCDSRVKRRLDASEYNKRRHECEEAVACLRSRFRGIEALRDISMQQLEQGRDLLDDLLFRRARHVVSENERVLQGMDVLRAGQLDRFGELLFSSHGSLRDDYEVSCRELDVLVELATAAPGIIGARMTGAGFGGCTINLVENTKVDAFAEEVRRGYRNRTGLQCEVYACHPTRGVVSQKAG